MRINPIASLSTRTDHAAYLPLATTRRLAVEATHRVPAVDPIWRADTLCWRRPWLRGPEPYWLAIHRENAWYPAVYPLPYWAVLEYTRHQREEAQRQATPSGIGEPASRPPAAPRQPVAESPTKPVEPPREVRLPAPRLGELPPVTLALPATAATRGYGTERMQSATGRLVDVLG